MEIAVAATEVHSNCGANRAPRGSCMQPCWNKFAVNHPHKMCVQMYFVFSCTFILGLMMLSIGCVFINASIASNNSINIMLCIMGIVCGLILIATSALLGRVFISRKCIHRESTAPALPESVCFQFHQCSVVHTLSHDQLNTQPGSQPDGEAPPSYEAVMSPQMTQMTIIHGGQNRTASPIIQVHCMALNAMYPPMHMLPQPPRYADSIAPLPEYSDNT